MLQGGVVEDADLAGVHGEALLADQLGDGGNLLLTVGALGEDNGILQAAPLMSPCSSRVFTSLRNTNVRHRLTSEVK